MSAIAAALLAAQKDMPRLHKDSEAEVQTKTGGKYKYQYLSLETMLEQVLPVLNRHGIALMQSPICEDGKLALKTQLVHETGDTYTSSFPLAVPADATPQMIGSALTYTRRYALMSVLGLAPDEDDDGAKAGGQQSVTGGNRETDVSPPATAISPKQFARIGALLGELEKGSPREEEGAWIDDVRDYMKSRFKKVSRKQLTQDEAGELIVELENWVDMIDVPFGDVPADGATVA